MSETSAKEVGSGGSRLVSEPAFELLFLEIIAYTGAYVAKSAASRATDVLRSTTAGSPEEVNAAGSGGAIASEEDGLVLEPSPASVGAGNAIFPVGSY